MKINFKKAIITLVLTLLYFSVFVRIYYIPSYNVFRNASLIFVFLFACLNYKVILKQKYLKTNIWLLCFVGIIIFSTCINSAYTTNYINEMIVFCLKLVLVYFVSEIVCERNMFAYMIKILYRLNLFVVLVTDMIMLLNAELVKKYEEYYLIGNKFTVTYAHLFLIALYIVLINFYKKKKIHHYINLSLLIVMTWLIASFVDCQSGIVGIICLIILLIMGGVSKRQELSAGFSMILLAASSLFVLVYDVVLSIPIVQNIVENYLGHSLTLSGRIYIYSRLPELLSEKLMLGYGYGTTYDLGMKYGDFPNTQNGLMEWIWQCGLVGTLFLLILIWNSLKKIKLDKEFNAKIIPLLALINVFTILASVEITINIMFLGVLAMIFAYSSQTNVKM